MTNELLLSILTKYCEYSNIEKTGLLLLDLPTGFGKTHETLKYIYDNYRKSSRKIIFLTELKKNLPHDTIFKSFFEKDHAIHDYHKDVIFIDANVDSVIDNLLSVESILPISIKQDKTFKALKVKIENYKALMAKKSKSKYEIEHGQNIKNELMSEFEPKFRAFVMKQLHLYTTPETNEAAIQQKKEKGSKKAAKIQLIQEHPDFQWITKVYPASLTSEKRVFFLSMDKFLAKNTTLVQPSYYFFNDDFFLNSLIFIDEFDACKKVMLKYIIENQSRKRVDMVGVLEQIYSSLQSLTLPEIFTLNESGQEDKQVKAIIDKINRLLTQIKNDYKINYSIKTVGLKNQKNFLFHDNQYHTIVNNEQKYIYFEPDEVERINKIHFVEDKELLKDKPSVVTFLRTVYYFISSFKANSKLIAHNFQDNKNKPRGFKEDLFSLENALKSFYAALKISIENQKYLIDNYRLSDLNTQKKQYELYHNDGSFYSTGFRCYDFEDSESHDTQSKVFMTDFDITPEKMLLDLASSNMVIGISATAKLDSVLCNYDLIYLRNKLGVGQHFYELSDEENATFKIVFNKKTEHYVPIRASFIQVEDVKSRLRTFKLDPQTRQELITQFERLAVSDAKKQKQDNSTPPKQNLKNYQTVRYLKIATVFQEFIKNDNIKSFLCFLNTHPEYEKASCDLNVLNLLFEGIIKAQQKEAEFTDEKGKFEVRNSYFVVNSQEFEAKKAFVTNRLKKGKKLFLITTYRTLGAGQNIQYEIDALEELLDTGKIKQIAKRGQSVENQKDFDAIYLDKPTHLMVNLKGEGELSEFDINKRIFDLQMLHAHEEIFKSQVFYEIERTFQRAYYNNKGRQIEIPAAFTNLYQTESYNNAVAKEVIQAIGRMNRTNIKNNEIYIFADSEIAPYIKSFDVSQSICLKEFEALIQAAQFEKGEVVEKPNRLAIQIERRHNESHNWIQRKINKDKGGWDWTAEEIKDWESLRETVLRHPTAAQTQLNQALKSWNFIYLPMLNPTWKAIKATTSYRFKEDKDYFKIELDFSGSQPWQEVSAAAVYLPELMKIKELRAFFESKGYATDFQKNEYIINPEIFNNIYKGALGEAIGQFLLENYVIPTHKLQSLPQNIYERFDFMLTHGVFIDFKFWNDRSRESRINQINKIFNTKVPYILKQEIPFQKVFIINILANGEFFEIQSSKDSQLIEVPYLIDKQTFEIDKNILIQLQNHFIQSFI